MALAPIHPEGPEVDSTLAPVQPEGLDVTAGGGGGSPGGLTGEVQYNNGGSFGGITAGAAGEVLTSAGAGVPPTWEPAAGGSLPTPTESAGYQDVLFTSAKVGGDATGLANDATTYSAEILVEGVVNLVSVVGSASQTFTALCASINADLSGATAAMTNGFLRITSAATGASSSILIQDTSLFFVLTDYLAIHGAVDGLGTQGTTLRYNGAAWEAYDLVQFDNADNILQIGPLVANPLTGHGFAINIYGQSGGVGGNFIGGSVSIVGGAGSREGVGGDVTITAGAGSGVVGAGNNNDVSAGGGIFITSGIGWNEASGSISIQVPNVSAASFDVNGNTISIEAGTGASVGGVAHGGSVYLTGGEQAGGGTDGSVVLGINNIDSNTRTGNFMYIPVCNGTPSGTPISEGFLSPVVYDYAAHRLYIYDTFAAAWVAAGGSSIVVSANTLTLTAADSGNTYLLTHGSGTNCLLPAGATGLHYKFVLGSQTNGDESANKVTANGADRIWGYVSKASPGGTLDITNDVDYLMGDGTQTAGDWCEVFWDGAGWALIGVTKNIAV